MKRNSPSTLQAIREKLNRAQSVFFRAADTITAEKWGDRPGLNEWSAAELVAHLIGVERAIVTRVDQLTQKAAIPVPFPKRMHLPLWAGGGARDSPEIAGATG